PLWTPRGGRGVTGCLPRAPSTLRGMPAGDDEAFCAEAAGALARLPGVRAVALGGSRAARTARPDSDWDFAVYYRGSFDPASLGTLQPGAAAGDPPPPAAAPDAPPRPPPGAPAA